MAVLVRFLYSCVLSHFICILVTGFNVSKLCDFICRVVSSVSRWFMHDLFVANADSLILRIMFMVFSCCPFVEKESCRVDVPHPQLIHGVIISFTTSSSCRNLTNQASFDHFRWTSLGDAHFALTEVDLN